jgi:predicted O-methyltransferase YrrM
MQLVRPGGLIAVDNVLFYGRVADEAEQSKATVALRAFNDLVMADPRISLSIVPVGDGMALCRKRPAGGLEAAAAAAAGAAAAPAADTSL